MSSHPRLEATWVRRGGKAATAKRRATPNQIKRRCLGLPSRAAAGLIAARFSYELQLHGQVWTWHHLVACVRHVRRQAEGRILQIFTSCVPLDFDARENGINGQGAQLVRPAKTSAGQLACGAETAGAENGRYITCKNLQKRASGLP